MGALKITEVQLEIFKSWGSYQLMAVTFVPILQADLHRAVTVSVDITGSGVLGKGRDLKLKTGALKAVVEWSVKSAERYCGVLIPS